MNSICLQDRYKFVSHLSTSLFTTTLADFPDSGNTRSVKLVDSVILFSYTLLLFYINCEADYLDLLQRILNEELEKE